MQQLNVKVVSAYIPCPSFINSEISVALDARKKQILNYV